jgi:hypothetical protein
MSVCARLGCLTFLEYLLSSLLVAGSPCSSTGVPSMLYGGIDDRTGEVRLISHIANLDVGADRLFPIVMLFSPSAGGVSHYLGDGGWHLPVFESRVVEQSEGRVRAFFPDGSDYSFTQLGEDFYRGENGWLARRDGEDFLVSSHCADVDFKFSGGRLSEFSFSGIRFKIRYSDGSKLELLPVGREAALITGAKGSLGIVESLHVGKTIFDFEQKLATEVIALPGGATIREFPVLSRVTERGTGAYFSYEMKADEDEAGMLIGSTFGQIADVKWNKGTHLVTSLNGWEILVADDKDGLNITRRNDVGDMEWVFRSHNGTVEREKVGSADEVQRTYDALGLRKVERRLPGENEWHLMQRFYRNEAGAIIREINNEKGYEVVAKEGSKEHPDALVIQRRDFSGKLLRESIQLPSKNAHEIFDYERGKKIIYTKDEANRITNRITESLAP